MFVRFVNVCIAEGNSEWPSVTSLLALLRGRFVRIVKEAVVALTILSDSVSAAGRVFETLVRCMLMLMCDHCAQVPFTESDVISTLEKISSIVALTVTAWSVGRPNSGSAAEGGVCVGTAPNLFALCARCTSLTYVLYMFTGARSHSSAERAWTGWHTMHAAMVATVKQPALLVSTNLHELTRDSTGCILLPEISMFYTGHLLRWANAHSTSACTHPTHQRTSEPCTLALCSFCTVSSTPWHIHSHALQQQPAL